MLARDSHELIRLLDRRILLPVRPSRAWLLSPRLRLDDEAPSGSSPSSSTR